MRQAKFVDPALFLLRTTCQVSSCPPSPAHRFLGHNTSSSQPSFPSTPPRLNMPPPSESAEDSASWPPLLPAQPRQSCLLHRQQPCTGSLETAHRRCVCQRRSRQRWEGRGVLHRGKKSHGPPDLHRTYRQWNRVSLISFFFTSLVDLLLRGAWIVLLQVNTVLSFLTTRSKHPNTDFLFCTSCPWHCDGVRGAAASRHEVVAPCHQ
jgi:hypothetical protein